MPTDVRKRFERYCDAPNTWDPVDGGRRAWLMWDDHLHAELSQDASAERFEAICELILGGRYYPPDAIECFGPWMDEGRRIRPGDRMLQRARMVPFLKWPALWSMTEIFLAECSDDRCALGYVTTKRHFGRGIWQATLTRKGGDVELEVRGTAGPATLLFWLGLPYARWLQKRAWRRAKEEFVRILGGR